MKKKAKSARCGAMLGFGPADDPDTYFVCQRAKGNRGSHHYGGNLKSFTEFKEYPYEIRWGVVSMGRAT